MIEDVTDGANRVRARQPRHRQRETRTRLHRSYDCRLHCARQRSLNVKLVSIKEDCDEARRTRASALSTPIVVIRAAGALAVFRRRVLQGLVAQIWSAEQRGAR